MRELSTLTCLIISLYDAPTATSCRADEHEEIEDLRKKIAAAGMTEEAKKALESGTRTGKKAVREACALALARLAAGPTGIPGEKAS